MSFSTKEKKILAFLGIFLLVFLYYKFFLSREMKDINALKNEIKVSSDTYAVDSTYKESIKGADSDLKILGQRLKDLRLVFPPVMNYDEVLIAVKDLAKGSGLSVDSLNFIDAKPLSGSSSKSSESESTEQSGNTNSGSSDKVDFIEKIDDFTKESGLGNDNGKSATEIGRANIVNGRGYELGVKISAAGTMAQIKGFLYRVENLKNKVTYEGMQIGSGENGLLSFSITIKFIGIADKNAGKFTMLEDGKWVPKNAAKKIDMFTPYEGYVGAYVQTPEESQTGSSSLTQVLAEIQKYDFTMRVMPYGDNMTTPTISLLAKKVVLDEKEPKMPIVYGDKDGEEKVDIYIEENSGKFFCKFKTEHEAFPDTGYSSLAEFKPIGNDIKLLIDSTARKFKKDNSGVLIKLTNKSKRNISVKVVGDDKNKPRVRFENLGTNIKVEYV